MTSPDPITVTKNGYDRFTCVRSEDFRKWETADARARLLERIMVSEAERTRGQSSDAFDSLASIREKYGL